MEIRRQCRSATVKEVEKIEEESDETKEIPKMEPEREFELFILEKQNPDQTAKIEKYMHVDLHMKIAETLVKNKDIFYGLPQT